MAELLQKEERRFHPAGVRGRKSVVRFSIAGEAPIVELAYEGGVNGLPRGVSAPLVSGHDRADHPPALHASLTPSTVALVSFD